jgi:hypothetical protein
MAGSNKKAPTTTIRRDACGIYSRSSDGPQAPCAWVLAGCRPVVSREVSHPSA